MSLKNEISINRWNKFSYIFISVVNFSLFTLIFKLFDSSLIGLYVLLLSAFVLGANLDLGFGVSTVKHIAEATEKKNFQFITEYFYTYLISFFILSVFILSLQFAYYYFFLRTRLSYPVEISDHIFLILSFNFVFSFVYNFFKCFLEGMAKYIFIAKVLIVSHILLFVFSTIFVIIYKDIFVFLYVQLAISIFIFVALIVNIYRYQILNSRRKFFNFKLIKDNIKYGAKIQISFAIGNSLDYIIKFIVSSFLSLSFVAIYESAKKVITFINGFIYSSQKVIIVKLSHLNILNKISEAIHTDIKNYTELSLKYIILFFGILNPSILVFLYFWFGNLDSSTTFLLLALPQTLICLMIAMYNVIIIEGRGSFIIVIQIINVLSTTVLLYMSTKLTGSYLGLIGYFIAIVINSIIIVFYFYKHFNFNFQHFFKDIGFFQIISLQFFLLIQIILLHFNINFIVVVTVSQIVFIIAYYKILLEFLYIIFDRINQLILK
ncbi:hypothetical protein FBQ84_07915 [Ignavibacteria bacterium CHB1]|nr:MAG: hypothetical protein EDM69_09075 [Chlorobiota bacterium]MBV6399658.1 hypothetical protein [Ignavibacteria bacterium]MCC6885650.1 oligosaccharide flippase family protein [Ignavibacteriales bacterium]MCE7953814.1 hypothetical protein [Chlorobi bacterium CHB7]MDL1887748.1 hypothetical protein [Ignavibacteria bacterium CHB1]RIK48296.1 MAG: hypothetical protein DCC60_08050 [Ignavibacteriota bacterium]